MDLRRVRTFVTVAEQGTVSKAAVHLRVAQPALSRQIRDLEQELGFRLFDRIRKRLVLTNNGEQLLTECRNVMSAFESLGERAELLQRVDAGVLKVAATPQTLEGVLSGFLHQYAARFPNVEVRLSEAVGRGLATKVEHGEVHFAIGFLQAIQDDREFESFPLTPIEFLAASHPSLRLGTAGDVEIGNLAPYPLLLMDPSFYVRQTFDAACRLARIKTKIFLESRTPHTLLTFAEAGHGVAVVPTVLPTHRHRLRLARITHRRRPLQEVLTLFSDRRRVLPSYAQDFCNSLKTYVREVFPISHPGESAGHAKRTGQRVKTS